MASSSCTLIVVIVAVSAITAVLADLVDSDAGTVSKRLRTCNPQDLACKIGRLTRYYKKRSGTESSGYEGYPTEQDGAVDPAEIAELLGELDTLERLLDSSAGYASSKRGAGRRQSNYKGLPWATGPYGKRALLREARNFPAQVIQANDYFRRR